ncbi:hypothetical protein BC834DRAFT_988858 [Gloeopeniophorella convolvens]|nr:hypothetical protein BC834DRAFT_988858 [Gloeopeniophorella convolvens]
MMFPGRSVEPASLRFRSLFGTALKEYTEQTGTALATHPLSAQLRECTSVDSIISVIQEQARAFDVVRKGDGPSPLRERLAPVVDIVLSLNEALGGVINDAGCKPGLLICAGLGMLLGAAKGISESYDALIELFDMLGKFLGRLKVYTELEPTVEMDEIIVGIMVELLSILALATKEIKRGRLRKFIKNLLGDKTIEGVMKRLKRLTSEESLMSAVHVLEVVHRLVNNVKVVTEGD